MVAVVIRRRVASLLLLAALLGCMRWRPLASSDLPVEARTLPLRTVRVVEADGMRELRAHRVSGTTIEGWNAARGREERVDLATARQAWVQVPNDAMNAVLVGAVYGLVFAVSWLALITGSR